LLRMSPDGSSRATLLSDPSSQVIHPVGCGGHQIIITWSNHAGSKKTDIWRVDTDGSNPKQLTFDTTDVGGYCSPDGQWVYYENLDSARVLRVPTAGGTPEEVPGTAGLLNLPGIALSSDGKFLVFFRISKDQKTSVGKLVLVPLDAGIKSHVKFFDVDPRFVGFPQFTPDGKALVYKIHEAGTDNLWQQPLDGSRGRQITNFPDDIIQFFLFSPDGKTLGVMRTHVESDVVLMHDTGPSAR